MARIIKYFTKKPNSVGVSTFQVANDEDYNIDSSGLNQNYQTLIGSCKDDWDAKDNHALLVHAADLFWGDAEFDNEKANEVLQGIDVHLEKDGKKYIRTSSDIIAVLEYLLAHMNDGPVLIPSLKLEPNTISKFTTAGKTQTITAILNNTNESVSNVKWSLTNLNSAVNCSSQFKLSADKGEKITLTGPSPDNNAALEPTLGQLSFTTSDWSTSEGTAVITGQLKGYQANSTNATQKVRVSASIDSIGVSATVDVEYSQSIAGKTKSTALTWNKVGSVDSNITMTQSNGEITLTNVSTEKDITVEAGAYELTSPAASAVLLSPKVTVPKTTAKETYYYYIGEASNFATPAENDDLEYEAHFKSNIGDLLKSFGSTKTSTTLYTEYGAYTKGTNLTMGPDPSFVSIIGPKTWVDNMSKTLYSPKTKGYWKRKDGEDSESQNFKINNTDYTIVVFFAELGPTTSIQIYEKHS